MSQRIADIRMTTDEYEEFGRAGLFDPSRRFELLDGEIYERSPIGSPHAGCVAYLTSALLKLAGDRMILFPQNPVRLSDLSEPQPDIMLLRSRADFYREGHPDPNDVALLIEVADTTVALDRRTKLPLYATAGIREVWIVNLAHAQIELYAEPLGGAFQHTEISTRGTTVTSKTVEGISLAADDILG